MASSTLYYFIAKGIFPKPYKLGEKTVAWLEKEVDEWIESRIRTSSVIDHGIRKSSIKEAYRGLENER